MKTNLLALMLAAMAADHAYADPAALDFVATFTHGVFHTPATTPIPIATTLTFVYDITDVLAPVTSQGYTRKELLADFSAGVADSPVFALLPKPHIDWAAAPITNSLNIERLDSTLQFRLWGTSSLSYSEGCIFKCTNYFKAISVVSDFVVPVGYDPFSDPIRFVSELKTSRTMFEANVIQDSWQRFDRGDRHTGSSLSTSINTLGFGSYWREGGAQLASFTSAVAEPSTFELLLASLFALPFLVVRARRSETFYLPNKLQ